MKKKIFVALLIIICFLSIFYLVLFTRPSVVVVLFDLLEPAVNYQRETIEDGIIIKAGKITAVQQKTFYFPTTDNTDLHG